MYATYIKVELSHEKYRVSKNFFLLLDSRHIQPLLKSHRPLLSEFDISIHGLYATIIINKMYLWNWAQICCSYHNVPLL